MSGTGSYHGGSIGYLGSGYGAISCTEVVDDAPYFYRTSNAPMSEWDFQTVWDPANDGVAHPWLRP